MAKAIAASGCAVEPGSRLAYAASEGDLKGLKAAGKLIICPRLEWLSQGASIAIVEENNRPQVYLNMSNLAASGVTLSDAILKIGKRL